VRKDSSVLFPKFVEYLTGSLGHPSPAWDLVENRPALLRRRRPSGRVAPWAKACDADFEAQEPTASRSRLARGPGRGTPGSPEFVLRISGTGH
jgi:hypothetical protein